MLKGWIPENHRNGDRLRKLAVPNKGGDGFSPTTSEQKWHKTKDLLNFVLFDGKNAFSGNKKKPSEMRNTQTDFPAIPSEIGKFIDSKEVPFERGS